MREQVSVSWSPSRNTRSFTGRVFVVLTVWLGIVLTGGAAGVIEAAPLRALPALIWGPVIAFVIAFSRSRRLREWACGIDLRWPIMFHLVRVIIGTVFLVLYTSDDLPAEFAIRGGWGDIAVGLTAVIAAMAIPAATALRRRVLFGWNTLGLLDILLVFVTAQRVLFFGDDPDAISILAEFPFLLAPLFVVPLVLITHFVIFARLWRTREQRT